jgi:hypothetical protein
MYIAGYRRPECVGRNEFVKAIPNVICLAKVAGTHEALSLQATLCRGGEPLKTTLAMAII